MGGLFGGGGGEGASFQGFEPGYIELPQYSFTEPRLRLTSDFLSDNIQRMGEGKFPSYYENAMPQMREGMSRGNYQSTFGRPGERTGTVTGAQQAGAAMGLGPRQGIANVNKALYDYADREKAIDEYLTKLGVDITSQAAIQMPQIASQMPRGPEVMTWGPSGQYVQQQADPWGGILGNMLGGMDLGGILGGAGKMLGGAAGNAWGGSGNYGTETGNQINLGGDSWFGLGGRMSGTRDTGYIPGGNMTGPGSVFNIGGQGDNYRTGVVGDTMSYIY